MTASVDYIGADEAFAASADLVTDASRTVSNRGPAGGHRRRRALLFVRPQAADLAELSRQVEAGAIRIEVQQVFPLADAAKAHEVSQGGHVRGKLVVEV